MHLVKSRRTRPGWCNSPPHSQPHPGTWLLFTPGGKLTRFLSLPLCIVAVFLILDLLRNKVPTSDSEDVWENDPPSCLQGWLPAALPSQLPTSVVSKLTAIIITIY